MVVDYLDHAVVKIPAAKSLQAALDWHKQVPGAQAPPRRGPSGQSNAQIMQCSEQMCEIARTILYSKRTYTFSFRTSVPASKESIGENAYMEIRHLELPLRLFETATHSLGLVDLSKLKTLVLLCDKGRKANAPLLNDAVNLSLYRSQEPLSRVGLSPQLMINNFVLEMHRNVPEAILSIKLKLHISHDEPSSYPRYFDTTVCLLTSHNSYRNSGLPKSSDLFFNTTLSNQDRYR